MFCSRGLGAATVCLLITTAPGGHGQAPSASTAPASAPQHGSTSTAPVAGLAQTGSAPGGTTSTGSGQTQTGATRVHGLVADPDGAAIPGASVVFTSSKGPVRRVTSGGDGSYSVSLTPGTYSLTVSMQGFSAYSVQNLRVPAVSGMTVDAKLQVGEENVVVNVDANALQLSVDPDSNASSTVLQGKDLDALSDDPDELQSELEALAGPAAGPNGGQIYVDGFTGGQLPPKSSIREVRINQNPFSAEYDRIGYGRVEVFTKPGTDRYHGSFQVNGNPSQFNSPNPLSPAYEPPYHTIFMFGSLTGPLNKNTSFSVGGSHRDIEDNAFTNATVPLSASGSTTPCAPGSPTCILPSNEQPNVQIFTHYPQVRIDISPRFDFALGEKNVLTVRYQYVQNDATNAGLSSPLQLPDNLDDYHTKTNTLQLSDTQTWSPKLINETRFEYERDRSSYAPVSTAPQVSVEGEFTSGGASSQSTTDHQDHFEVQNYTSVALKQNFIRFGGRLRTTRESQYAATGTNGTFIYPYLSFNPATDCSNGSSVAAGTCTDNSYLTGIPSQFQLTRLNTDDVHYNYADLGLYAEDDWKPVSNFTFSYGLRYETQNYLYDHHDFAPRLSFSWGVGKSKSSPITVIRGGFGIFYDRFTSSYILNTVRSNGVAETLYTETTVPAGCSPSNVAACITPGVIPASSVYTESDGTLAPRLRAPYSEQAAIGFDQQVTKRGTVSVNYFHTLGVHQFAIQNAAYPTNAINPSAPYTPLPDVLIPNEVNNQYFSEGEFHQNQLQVNGRVSAGKVSLFGYYGLSFAAGDSSGAGAQESVPYDLHADYGRTSFDVRNRVFLAGSITLPQLIQVSPFIIGQSGNPYNITYGKDTLNDSFFNERPDIVPFATAANGSTIKTIPGCGTFAEPGAVAGASIAPINACTGPGLFTFNMRLTKSFGFGGKVSPNGQGGPGGHGGGGHGGPFGHGGFGGTSTGRRYSLAVGVITQNLFNNRDLGTPVGVLTSGVFGQSLNLAGGPYTQQSAVRRIQLQASFNF